MKNTEDSDYKSLTEDEDCISYLIDEKKVYHSLQFIERWSKVACILAVTAFCFSIVVGISVILVSRRSNNLIIVSSACYYFLGGTCVLAVAWRFKDAAKRNDKETESTKEQRTTAVIASSFMIGGIELIICSAFDLQRHVYVRDLDIVWLPLAAGSGGFFVLAALLNHTSRQLHSKATRAATCLSALMSILSVGLMLSHLILAFEVFHKNTWFFLDPFIATAVAVVSIVWGAKLALNDISV